MFIPEGFIECDCCGDALGIFDPGNGGYPVHYGLRRHNSKIYQITHKNNSQWNAYFGDSTDKIICLVHQLCLFVVIILLQFTSYISHSFFDKYHQR